MKVAPDRIIVAQKESKGPKKNQRAQETMKGTQTESQGPRKNDNGPKKNHRGPQRIAVAPERMTGAQKEWKWPQKEWQGPQTARMVPCWCLLSKFLFSVFVLQSSRRLRFSPAADKNISWVTRLHSFSLHVWTFKRRKLAPSVVLQLNRWPSTRNVSGLSWFCPGFRLQSGFGGFPWQPFRWICVIADVVPSCRCVNTVRIFWVGSFSFVFFLDLWKFGGFSCWVYEVQTFINF